MPSTIYDKSTIAEFCQRQRDAQRRIVFTNGCFDVLHAGHIELLERAKSHGDILIVGINSDDSVRRLKGENRPIHSLEARAKVLLALRCVDAVARFDEDTPIEIIDAIRPDIHVKGGDYRAEDLPESDIVRKNGGEIVIVPLVEGFSTTSTLTKLNDEKSAKARTVLAIPARYGSTRFPGKPLAQLAGESVIVRVVRAGLQTRVQRPLLVATDNDEIADAVKSTFSAEEAVAVMTDESCRSGTDRVAQAVQRHFDMEDLGNLLILNVQGDEPFVNSRHLDALLEAMQQDANCLMGTLATPLESAAIDDPNVVKVVTDLRGYALYFSRYGIPLQRDLSAKSTFERLHHIGVYAYRGDWLQKMANLSATPLENTEMLEQLRALENGAKIRVVRVKGVVPIAIDTPEDLRRAEQYIAVHKESL